MALEIRGLLQNQETTSDGSLNDIDPCMYISSRSRGNAPDRKRTTDVLIREPINLNDIN